MGLFKLRQELAIDLGTANIVIMKDDRIVFNEPSVIAFDRRNDEMVAVGTKAREIYEKGHKYIRSVRPLRGGITADFDAAEKVIRGMVKQINEKSHSLFSPSLRMVVSVPSGNTEVEIRAMKDSSEHAGGRDVYMLYELMAAAIGIGIDILAPEGNVIVDVGGGTTEIAVISLGGISPKRSIRMAGNEFTHDTMEYIHQRHNVYVGERTAERIRIEVGSALVELDNAPEDFVVTSADLMDSLPRQISVSYQEIAQCLDKSIVKIESTILRTLENTPPELYIDVTQNGVSLTGGGTLLRGLAERLTRHFAIQFNVPEDPLRAVAMGTDKAFKNVDSYNFLIHQRGRHVAL